MTVKIINLLRMAATVALAASTAYAGTPADYYTTVDDTSPVTLRSTLNNIITSNHATIDFGTQSGNSTASFNALKVADEDLADTSSVRLIYSKDTRLKSADHNQDSNPATGGWNREHAWPQSFYDMDLSGDGDRPMVDDLHSLFSCDADINNTGRNDKEYDYVTTPTITTDVFGNKWNSSRFEPRGISKGDAARAIFYMDVRFEGESTEPNLVLQNTVGSSRVDLQACKLEYSIVSPK